MNMHKYIEGRGRREREREREGCIYKQENINMGYIYEPATARCFSLDFDNLEHLNPNP